MEFLQAPRVLNRGNPQTLDSNPKIPTLACWEANSNSEQLNPKPSPREDISATRLRQFWLEEKSVFINPTFNPSIPLHKPYDTPLYNTLLQ